MFASSVQRSAALGLAAKPRPHVVRLYPAPGLGLSFDSRSIMARENCPTTEVIVKREAAGPTGWRGEVAKLATTHIRHLVNTVSRRLFVRALSRELSIT